MKKAIFCMIVVLITMNLQEEALCQEQWVQQNSGTTVTLYRVQFLDVDNGYATGDAGTVLKTSNGGASWIDVSIPSTYPVSDLSFVTPLLGWVVTGDPNNSMSTGSVWNTSDGGTTWNQQSLGTTNARLGVSFVSATNGWACGANNGPWDIRATTNGGSSWTLQSGSGYGWTYDIDCISSTLGWTVGVVYFPSSSGFVLKTTNGTSWTQLNTGTVPFLYGVQFVDANFGYAVGDAGTVIATVNGGSSWTTENTGTTNNLSDVSFITSTLGWICGSNGTILKTTDGGTTWNSQTSGTSNTLNGLCFVNSTTGWAVGNGGTVLRYESGTGSAIGISLTPYNPPIQIPSSGGSFDFNIEIANNGSSSETFDIWTMATLPNGLQYGPIIEVPDFTVPAAWIGDRDRVQLVPGNAPTGLYTYDAYVGTYPDSIWNEDHFDFEKLAGENDAQVYSWECCGEQFHEDVDQVIRADKSSLVEVHPNPFNPVTSVFFTLPVDGKVKLNVYDITGKLVTSLTNGWRVKGVHQVSFDGSALTSGVYIYELSTENVPQNGKMVLLK